MRLISLSWWRSTTARTFILVRSAWDYMGNLIGTSKAPARPGISTGRVASAREAEDDLSAMAKSPTIFAAVNKRAFSLATYPVAVYFGFNKGGDKADALDPDKVSWVADLLRLLQTPDAGDAEGVFPVEPGPHLLAQLIADYLLAGIAYVAMLQTPDGVIVGLYRLHPRHVTLERNVSGMGDEFVYRPITGLPRRYPRRSVACIRGLSWQSGGMAEMGVGAGQPLKPLIEAEWTALQQTASVVGQGGADVLVTGNDPQTNAFLSNKTNRDEVAKLATTALAGGVDGGRRVMVLPGNLKMEDTGLKPADMKAPELMAAAKTAELAALGCTPIAIGGDASTFATAVQQYRVQAELDEALAKVFEDALLRPLARHFARMAGGKWAMKADRVTCRIDLSGHPGYTFQRTEAINRMVALVGLGWGAAQAAEAEGVEMPVPEGPPRATTTPAPSGAPNGPVGDGSAGRTLADLFTRTEAPTIVVDPVEESRAARWRLKETEREKADSALHRACKQRLEEELQTYQNRIAEELGKKQRAVGDLQTRVSYGALDWSAIFGPEGESEAAWLQGLSPDWLQAWRDAAQAALNGTKAALAPMPGSTAATLAPLEASAAAVADYSRSRVRAVVEQGLADGATIREIQAALAADQGFSPARALRIARTETVRSDSAGTKARYESAIEAGYTVKQEWLTARDSHVRDSHRALDQVVVEIGQVFTFPGGPSTEGPGLSGDPSEDCNCRCALSPVVD